MGNEAAAAEHSGEIIHYLAQEIAPGIVVNMQTMYMTWAAMAILIVLFVMAGSGAKMIPSGLQNVMELFIDFLNGMMEDTLGIKGRKFMAPFVITLFMFIFIANEIGLMPNVLNHFHLTSPTNDVNTCFALSLTVAFSVYVVGIIQHGMGHFKHFVSPSPAFLPLHLMDEITKPLTMALRLFGNILAGEILLIVLYQLAPWVVPELWVMFSLFIGFLQAFIFTMLTLTSFATVFAHHE